MQLGLWLLIFIGTTASLSTINYEFTAEYTTNGEVKLNIMNLTFHTTELYVTLLGCDNGYYDSYAMSPPKAQTWKTQITPFHCLECQCANFDRIRSETFYV